MTDAEGDQKRRRRPEDDLPIPVDTVDHSLVDEAALTRHVGVRDQLLGLLDELGQLEIQGGPVFEALEATDGTDPWSGSGHDEGESERRRVESDIDS